MERNGWVSSMEKRVVCEKVIFQKKIHAEMVCLQEGISVLIYGGDKPHIGAISIAGPDGKLSSTVFPKHKDHYISDVWAGELYARYRCPVVVSAGIHFDDITEDEIQEIEALSQSMLMEVCRKTEEKDGRE
ncbi:MAG: hypothetical protein ACI4TB_07300 [Lachnospiraceae bacterium]